MPCRLVLQQDGAGPHKEGCFDTCLNAEKEARERLQRIDQGPNGPCMNALDAVVFPGMSKQHSNFSNKTTTLPCRRKKSLKKLSRCGWSCRRV
jgi:hypothetical protein